MSLQRCVIVVLIVAVVGLSAALAFGAGSSRPQPAPLGDHGVYVLDAGEQPYLQCPPRRSCPASRARQVASFVLRVAHRSDVLVSAIAEVYAGPAQHSGDVGLFATIDGRQATAAGRYAQEVDVSVPPGPEVSATAPYQALIASVPAGRHRIALVAYAGGMRVGPVSLVAHPVGR